MSEGDRVCLNCNHIQSKHRWTTDGFCMVDKCPCGELKTSG